MPFYGIPSVPQDFANLHADVLGHYALNDDWLTRGDIDDVRATIERNSHGTVQFHFYEAGHAFLNDENLLGTYNEDAADTAWRRTVEFLHS